LIYISHRGNLDGPSDLENLPSRVDECLNNFFDCEIDLWVEDRKFLLGHDFGQYPVEKNWLIERQNNLWVHCKNSEAISALTSSNDHSLNFFWHQNDSYTITSKKFVWVYPGSPVIQGSVAVLPEKWQSKTVSQGLLNAYAICTDYIWKYKGKF